MICDRSDWVDPFPRHAEEDADASCGAAAPPGVRPRDAGRRGRRYRRPGRTATAGDPQAREHKKVTRHEAATPAKLERMEQEESAAEHRAARHGPAAADAAPPAAALEEEARKDARPQKKWGETLKDTFVRDWLL